MNIPRYRYLFLPVTRFINQLSPETQRMLPIVRATLLLVLIGFELAAINGVI